MGVRVLDWILLDFTGFYWVLQGFTGFYWVLQGFTWFYWVLLGFGGSSVGDGLEGEAVDQVLDDVDVGLEDAEVAVVELRRR